MQPWCLAFQIVYSRTSATLHRPFRSIFCAPHNYVESLGGSRLVCRCQIDSGIHDTDYMAADREPLMERLPDFNQAIFEHLDRIKQKVAKIEANITARMSAR